MSILAAPACSPAAPGWEEPITPEGGGATAGDDTARSKTTVMATRQRMERRAFICLLLIQVRNSHGILLDGRACFNTLVNNVKIAFGDGIRYSEQ
jgi:hypothetical protein